jgi:hypothetical protein
VALQLVWAWTLVAAYRASRQRGETEWAAIFAFFIAYWAAFMTNAMFDVFLEGPMGGIWFWTLFGAGCAAAYIYRTNPSAIRA